VNGGQVTNVTFTPAAGEGGTTQVIVNANPSYSNSLGTFTLTLSFPSPSIARPVGTPTWMS
jgi:hypothetical protein